jgi:DNA-binding beta-propeller fold protein YncE
MKYKMRKSIFSVLLMVSVVIIFVQCSDDPEPVEDSFFNNGVFIVNEGNFTDSDGSLSYYDFDSAHVGNNVFESINSRPLAAIFQSMAFYNAKGYIIDSNGRIEIVNEKDMTSAGTINSGLSLPRYFAGHSDLGYVTDWGPYDDLWMNPDSKIHILDLDNMQIRESLSTPSRPEAIMEYNDLIYITHSATNLITVYSPGDHEVIDSIEVNNGPVQFVIDKNQDLWVISTGAYISGGALQKIDLAGAEVIHTVDLSGISPNGRLSINDGGDLLFFMGETWSLDYTYTENRVFKASINLPGDYTEIISERNLYGLGVDPLNDEVYVADAVAFQGNGKIYTYDFSGRKQSEYTVGRGPRDFVFMYE